ncbi:MAG: Demethylrebeccamycin-D-glucose O-methyltransferase [Chlamydiae bacterium]|nr:Demethylrebeccamycin-D-glucose O-methyltransferase [Chlamydiota bacterium]
MVNKSKLMENLTDLPRVDADTIKFYSGLVDRNGMEVLFPDLSAGCINFGYWNKIPPKISKSARLSSQIRLYEEVISFLEVSKHQSVLEVGCGRGHGVQMLLNSNIDSFGIDAVPSQISVCRKNYPKEADRFIQGYAGSIPFPDDNFHGIISVEAAQHFPNFSDFAKESYRILRKNGALVVSTFFYTGFFPNPMINGILPENVLGSHHAIGIEQAKEILNTYGFSKISVHSIGNHVFKGFCTWAKQQKPETEHSCRWIEAFESELLDYYIIKCNK